MPRTHEYSREGRDRTCLGRRAPRGRGRRLRRPFHRHDVDEYYLPALDYSHERVAWTEAHRDAFDACSLVGCYPARAGALGSPGPADGFVVSWPAGWDFPG